MDKQIDEFRVIVQKRGDTIEANIQYRVSSTDDPTLGKGGGIGIPSNNAKVTAIVNTAKTLIKNKENIS